MNPLEQERKIWISEYVCPKDDCKRTYMVERALFDGDIFVQAQTQTRPCPSCRTVSPPKYEVNSDNENYIAFWCTFKSLIDRIPPNYISTFILPLVTQKCLIFFSI